MKYLKQQAYADTKSEAVKLAIFFLLIQIPVERIRGVAIDLKEYDGEYLATAIAFSPRMLIEKEGVPGDDLHLHPCEIRYMIEQFGISLTIHKLADLWKRKYSEVVK
jgi:hypothetical protein